MIASTIFEQLQDSIGFVMIIHHIKGIILKFIIMLISIFEK